MTISRRQSLKTIGLALSVSGLSAAAHAVTAIAPGARALEALTAKLASSPRRRDFKTLPMVLEHRDQWDAEALDTVLRYPAGPKQCWDTTDIAGPWLNVMRNAINAQVWSFHHPDFLCVSATHGSAQLALYDDAMWEKYGLAKNAGGNIARNRFAAAPPDAGTDPKDFQNPTGAYSSHATGILPLQQRGVVFLACHNAVWELSDRLIAAGTNPDKLTIDRLCAELTNHLIPGVIMTPGSVGTVVELAKAGFSYAR